MKKKLIASLLLVTMAVTLFAGCSKAPEVDSQVKAALDGKKVLFVGSSYTYYGGCVVPADESNISPFSQEERRNDTGYFYQLCRANGVNVEVTDWTFGGHGLAHILDGEKCTKNPMCEAGVPESHLSDLQDRKYDYVILEAGYHGNSVEEIVENMKRYIKIFKDANPDVKIYYSVHHGIYIKSSPDQKSDGYYYPAFRLEAFSQIEDLGVTVLDWGTLVWDVAHGKAQVPGGTMDYNKNSFVISKDPMDGNHQNMLAGYLTALMTFCAITGVDAVGQPYDFCYSDANEAYPVSTRFLAEYYKETYYRYDNKETPDVNERQTNFIEIFNSEADMRGLQSLVNTYLDRNTNAWEKYILEKKEN